MHAHFAQQIWKVNFSDLPAVKAKVALSRDDDRSRPFERAHQGETAEDGSLQLDGFTPAHYRIFVQTTGKPGRLAKETVTVLPGQQSIVQVTLQQ